MPFGVDQRSSIVAFRSYQLCLLASACGSKAHGWRGHEPKQPSSFCGPSRRRVTLAGSSEARTVPNGWPGRVKGAFGVAGAIAQARPLTRPGHPGKSAPMRSRPGV